MISFKTAAAGYYMSYKTYRGLIGHMQLLDNKQT